MSVNDKEKDGHKNMSNDIKILSLTDFLIGWILSIGGVTSGRVCDQQGSPV